MLFGAIGGALHALATVVFGVDHIVSGVAINIIAVGVAAFLAEPVVHRPPGRRPDPVATGRRSRAVNLPVVADWAKQPRGQALVPGLRPGLAWSAR